jgi:hypothetical protein
MGPPELSALSYQLSGCNSRLSASESVTQTYGEASQHTLDLLGSRRQLFVCPLGQQAQIPGKKQMILKFAG